MTSMRSGEIFLIQHSCMFSWIAQQLPCLPGAALLTKLYHFPITKQAHYDPIFLLLVNDPCHYLEMERTTPPFLFLFQGKSRSSFCTQRSSKSSSRHTLQKIESRCARPVVLQQTFFPEFNTATLHVKKPNTAWQGCQATRQMKFKIFEDIRCAEEKNNLHFLCDCFPSGKCKQVQTYQTNCGSSTLGEPYSGKACWDLQMNHNERPRIKAMCAIESLRDPGDGIVFL